MEPRKIYPLRNDIVFKFVFGKEGNEPILARLIDALLHFEGDHCISELQLLNPLNLKAYDDDKFTIVDVKAVDRAGRRFSIEMQGKSEPHLEKRMAFYLARIFTDQLHDGNSFEAKVQPSDIAFIHTGQRAMIKVTAYESQAERSDGAITSSL